MKQTFLPKASEAVRTNIRHRRWQHALLAMAAVVVFVTVYMLILPAITMTSETSCGLAEHTHTEACYELRLVCGQEETPEGTEAHVHGPECYETQSALTCEQEESAGHTHSEACYGYTCGQEESEGHTHTDACYTVTSELPCTVAEGDGGHAHSDGCYDETGALVCGMSEGDGGHVHSDTCYTETSQLTCGQEESAGHIHSEACTGLICGQEESEGHTHTDTCYTEEQVLVCTQSEGHTHTDACYEQVLICEIPEHTHTDACYETEIGDEDVPLSEFLCGMEEHTHTDACYGEDGSLACTLPEHTHDESCLPQEETDFICGMEEHTHTEACYDADGNLTCTLPEHTHDESCLPQEETDFICGMEEHTHTDACYDADGNLTCTLPEHTHDESCLPEETDPNAFPEELPEGYREYTYQNEEGLSVLVYAPENAFAEDVTLYAEQLAEDSEAYAQAQADLDAAENVAEYDGMAALDVRFENADGTEVEPDASAGPVYVKIDVEALLPEDVDESTVAVQHHAEVSDGGIFGTGIFAGTEVAVETVADASADTGEVTLTPSAVTLTEEPVPAAENALTEEDSDAQALTEETAQPAARLDVEASFAVESFSTFTITWNDDPANTVMVYYVDTQGNQLEGAESESLSMDNNGIADLSDYATGKIGSNGFVYALLNYSDTDSYYEPDDLPNGTEATEIRWSEENGWEYKATDYSGWKTWELPENMTERRVYLVYESSSRTEVDTVDTIAEGITIQLFDYYRHTSHNDNKGNDIVTIGGLEFNTGDRQSDTSFSGRVNQWTGHYGSQNSKGGVLQGIVSSTLANDGYPTLSDALGGASMAALFGGYNTSNATITPYIANHLFQRDADGYYYYDSSTNFAELDTDSTKAYTTPSGDTVIAHDFTVYNEPIKNGQDTNAANDPKFLPFDSIDTEIKNENSYWNNYNYHFGMTVSTSFIMPKDGLVNGNPMIFEFAGDDDVWVFLDGKLALDMGGIHDNYQGYIDFAEGIVWIESVATGTSSAPTTSVTVDLWDLLGYASKEAWQEAWTYETHTLNFYYLERGAGASNCAIRFNLPTIPENSLLVGKELTASNEAAENQDLIEHVKDTLYYTFQVLEVDAAGNIVADDDGNPVSLISSGTYDKVDANGTKIGTVTVDEEGKFQLKADEYALFGGILANESNYIVRETMPQGYDNQYDGVAYEVTSEEGEQTTNSGDSSVTTGFVGYDTDTLSPEEDSRVLYRNKVDVDELSLLRITKAAAEGSVFTDSFTIQLTLGGEAVAVGTPYVLRNADGTFESCTVTTSGRIILSPGQTAEFTVLTGTEYTVREVNGNTYHVGYSATQKIGGSTWTSDGGGYTLTVTNPADGDPTASGVVGEIIGDITDATNATVEVTVTNSSYDFNTSLDLSKTLTGYSGDSYKFDFTVTQVDEDGRLVTEDTTGTPVGTTITIDSTDSETGTIYFGFKNTDEAGIYYYKVSEDIPESITDGVSYDTSYYIVTVQVSGSDGSMTASVTGVTKYSEDGTPTEIADWSDGISFTNALGGDLSITKVVEYTGNSDYVSKEVFAFEVTVSGAIGNYDLSYTDKDGDDLTWTSVKDYTGWLNGTNGLPTTVTFTDEKATVYIPAGATLTIQDLPATAQAKITETNTDGYSVKWSGNTATGAEMPGATVTTTEISNNPAVTCTNTTGAVLPSTGGPGVAHILTLGAMLALGAGALLLLQQRRKEGREP